MSTAHRPIFLIVTKNPLLSKLVKDILKKKKIVIKTSTPEKITDQNYSQIHYIIYLAQNNQQQKTTTTEIVNIYDLAKKYNSKVAIIDIFSSSIKSKNSTVIYQLLKQIGASRPLFRYIVSKDVFSQRDGEAVFELEKKLRINIDRKKINTSVNGENLLHPLTLEDLLSATLKALFLERTGGEKLTIIGDQLKDLDFAYLIKTELEKKSLSLDINTVEKNQPYSGEWFHHSASSRALLKWLPSDTNEILLGKKISLMIANPHPHKIFPSVDVEHHPPEQISLHKKEKKLLIFIPLTIFLVGLFVLITVTAVWGGALTISLNKTVGSLKHLNVGEVEKANKDLFYAQKSLDTASELSGYVTPIFHAFTPKFFLESNALVGFLKHSQLTIESVCQSYTISENLYHDLFTSSGNSSAVNLSTALQSRLRIILQELSQLKIITQKQFLSAKIIQKISETQLIDRLTIIEEQTTQGLKLLETLSLLLNDKKPQSIVILIQDNNELKSTGGVIKSLIIADIQDEKITNIHPLYSSEIDKKMIGQILAPEMVSSFTGRENLYFSDANYLPDFSLSSKIIEKFLINSQQIKPMVIIAIDTSTLLDIMTNLDLEKLIADIQTQSIPLIKIIRPVVNSISQDNLRIWFKDNQKENSISSYSFSGIVSPSVCHPLLSPENCFSDTVFLSESNYTVFPITPYQDRQIQHKINIQNNFIEHTFIIDYRYNQDTPNINRGYQGLYQIYLHNQAQFISLEKNNQVVNKAINKNLYNNLSFFQIPVSHTLGEPTTIKLVFRVPLNENHLIKNNFAYSLKIYHQPNTNMNKYQVIIEHPSNLLPSRMTAPTRVVSNQIIYQPQRQSTDVFGTQFLFQ